MNEQQKIRPQEPTRFLVFSASLRKDSLNTRLAKLAASVIEKNGGIVDFANMSEFDCPSMNQDLEINNFHPAGAEEASRTGGGHDGLGHGHGVQRAVTAGRRGLYRHKRKEIC